MDLPSIRKLIADAKLDKALVELLAFANSLPEDEISDSIRILTAKQTKGKKDSMLGLITNQESMQISAQVSYALLEIVKQLEDISRPTPSDAKKKVFISYNHADSDVAQRLKVALRNAGLDVIIDEEAMEAGADISEFIMESVVGSDVTLSIVSENSLLSGWVAMETINTFYLSKFDKNKRFIAGYIDMCFMDDEFPLIAAEKLDAGIADFDGKIDKYRKANLNFTNITVKRTRVFELRNNLPSIVERLNNSLTVDLREASWNRSIEKVINTIK